jgi:hypothetical protein
MAIVTAGVHDAGPGGLEVMTRRLLHRQGIHVGPDQYCRSEAPGRPHTNHTSLSKTGRDRIPGCLEPLGDEVSGTVLLITELWVPMKVPAIGDEPLGIDWREVDAHGALNL